MTEMLVAALREDAAIFAMDRRRKWARLCTRTVEVIEDGRRDPDLAADLRALAIKCDRKGHHALAGKLFAAAKAVE